MKSVEQIEAERASVLKRMGEIRWMRRGTISEQYLKVGRKGKKEPVLRGPYYVFSRHEGDHTVSRRLTDRDELEWARQGVEAHKEFKALCRRYEELTELLGTALRSMEGSGMEKKRLRSPSRRTKRSR